VNEKLKSALRAFVPEVLVHTGLIVAYLVTVLHFLGSWLYHLYKENRETYAVVALILIVVQGIFLEELAHALLKLIRPKEPSSGPSHQQ